MNLRDAYHAWVAVGMSANIAHAKVGEPWVWRMGPYRDVWITGLRVVRDPESMCQLLLFSYVDDNGKHGWMIRSLADIYDIVTDDARDWTVRRGDDGAITLNDVYQTFKYLRFGPEDRCAFICDVRGEPESLDYYKGLDECGSDPERQNDYCLDWLEKHGVLGLEGLYLSDDVFVEWDELATCLKSNFADIEPAVFCGSDAILSEEEAFAAKLDAFFDDDDDDMAPPSIPFKGSSVDMPVPGLMEKEEEWSLGAASFGVFAGGNDNPDGQVIVDVRDASAVEEALRDGKPLGSYSLGEHDGMRIVAIQEAVVRSVFGTGSKYYVFHYEKDGRRGSLLRSDEDIEEFADSKWLRQPLNLFRYLRLGPNARCGAILRSLGDERVKETFRSELQGFIESGGDVGGYCVEWLRENSRNPYEGLYLFESESHVDLWSYLLESRGSHEEMPLPRLYPASMLSGDYDDSLGDAPVVDGEPLALEERIGEMADWRHFFVGRVREMLASAHSAYDDAYGDEDEDIPADDRRELVMSLFVQRLRTLVRMLLNDDRIALRLSWALLDLMRDVEPTLEDTGSPTVDGDVPPF